MATFLRRLDTRWQEEQVNDPGPGEDSSSPGADPTPSGAIFMFPASSSCPTGYTRYDTLNNGRFPRGSTFPESGGAETHTHTYELPPHTHSVDLRTDKGSTSSFGSFINPHYGSGSSNSYHDHFVSGSTGPASTAFSAPTTSSASSLPPYATVLFCQKN